MWANLGEEEGEEEEEEEEKAAAALAGEKRSGRERWREGGRSGREGGVVK